MPGGGKSVRRKGAKEKRMNKVVLIGNLTGEPEIRSLKDGTVKCVFRIGVQRDYKSAQTGKREADFFTIVTWRSLAESCGKFLSKGRKVCVSGSLRNRSYLDGEVKKYVTEVAADNVEFLSPRGKEAEEPKGLQEESTEEENEEEKFFVPAPDYGGFPI